MCPCHLGGWGGEARDAATGVTKPLAAPTMESDWVLRSTAPLRLGNSLWSRPWVGAGGPPCVSRSVRECSRSHSLFKASRTSPWAWEPGQRERKRLFHLSRRVGCWRTGPCEHHVTPIIQMASPLRIRSPLNFKHLDQY